MPVIDARTYLRDSHMLLMFELGITYFVFFVTTLETVKTHVERMLTKLYMNGSYTGRHFRVGETTTCTGITTSAGEVIEHRSYGA
jgi:hypothetical protein